MKTMKKLLTVFIAFIMAFAVFAFSACDNFLPGNDDKTHTEKPDDTANKDPEKPGDKDPDKPVSPTVNNETVIAYALTDKKTYAEVQGLLNQKTIYNDYALGEDNAKGEKISTYLRYDVTDEIEGKTNLDTGDMDGVLLETYVDNDSDSESEPEVYELDLYLRDYEGFTGTSTENELYYNYSAAEMFEEMLYYNLGLILPEEMTQSEINEVITQVFEKAVCGEHYVLLKLADNFDALTVSDGKAVIDFNELAYNLITELKSYLETVDAATTTGEILKNATVKKIIMPVFDVITADELKTVFKTAYDLYGLDVIFNSADIEVNLEEVLVAPKNGEHSYDYLLRLISSEKARDAFNKVYAGLINPDFTGVPWTLEKVPVNYILDLLGFGEDAFTGYKDIALEYAQGLLESSTKTRISYTAELTYTDGETGEEKSNGFQTVTVDTAVIEFTLDGNKIVAQKISCDFTLSYLHLQNDPEAENTQYWEEKVDAASAEMTLSYSDEAFVLKDIGDMYLIQSRYEYTEQTVDIELHLYDDGQYTAYQPVTIKLKNKVSDGKITGFELYQSDGVTPITLTPCDPNVAPDMYWFNLTVQATDIMTGETGGRNVHAFVRFEPEYGYVDFFQNEDNSYHLYNKSYNSVQIIYQNTVNGFLNGDPFTPRAEQAD